MIAVPLRFWQTAMRMTSTCHGVSDRFFARNDGERKRTTSQTMQITPRPQNGLPRILFRLRLMSQSLLHLRVLERRKLILLIPIRVVLDKELACVFVTTVLHQPTGRLGHPGDDDNHDDSGTDVYLYETSFQFMSTRLKDKRTYQVRNTPRPVAVDVTTAKGHPKSTVIHWRNTRNNKRRNEPSGGEVTHDLLVSVLHWRKL